MCRSRCPPLRHRAPRPSERSAASWGLQAVCEANTHALLQSCQAPGRIGLCAMARFGPDTATCEVFTKREGVLAAVGHDLKLRPERFEIEADATSVRARFDPSSLRVAAAMRAGREDPAAVSERDRRHIERSCAREVLEATRFPEITFASSEVQSGS